jgi:hypothetical protein
MKSLKIAFACLMILSSTVSAGMFSLKSIKLPLWYNGEDEKGIQILSVPKVGMSSPGNWQLIELFDDPFEQYDPRKPKASALQREEDLNMIYAYSITTSAVYGDQANPDKPVKFVIDISHAQKTQEFSIEEVAKCAAVCIRDCFPKSLGVRLVLKDKDKEVDFEPPFEAVQ